MLLHVPNVLAPDALAQLRQILAAAAWGDGRMTAGDQSAQVKNNQQLPEESADAQAARKIVLDGLAKSLLFFTAALPKRTFPPLFNRYDGTTNEFGNHVDNAIRTRAATGQSIRTDLSCTLFISDPADYDGGELVVEDTYGSKSVKLPAGDLILYPATSVHRVEPVTRGARIASFFWIESMVRDDGQRRLLFDLDMSILALREAHGDTADIVRLTGCYHNLVRRWADA
ncbi:MAG: Fe2+-dependent dioxygenase [Burkholderiales bacterium]